MCYTAAAIVQSLVLMCWRSACKPDVPCRLRAVQAALPCQIHVSALLESDQPLSTMQATILLLFNEADALSYADIQAAVKLEDSELRRTLASLCLAKER